MKKYKNAKAQMLFLIVPFISDYASAAVLEEIVVTAQKRAESLQDVPISVNAISGDLIQERNYADLSEATASIPNVSLTSNGVDAFMYVRGVGSGENAGFEQSVGTFIDGVYFGRGKHSGNQFMDLERMEVLRGPQSIFFGNSAIAGAFNLTTKKPGDSWEGYVTGLYEAELEGKEIEFAAGGALTDTLGVRVAGRAAETEGWVENVVNGENDPRSESHGFRITFAWQPTASFDASYKVDYSEWEILGAPYEAFKCPPAPGIDPGLACLLKLADPVDSAIGLNFRRVAGGEAPPVFPGNAAPPAVFAKELLDNEMLDHNLTMNWELDSGHIVTSTTGYIEADADEYFDSDQTRYALISVNRVEEFDQFSQELRLTSPSGQALEYMAGLYYHETDLKINSDFRVNLATPALEPMVADQRGMFSQDEELMSVFVQAKYHFADSFSASLGFRYTDVEKDGVSVVDIKALDGVSAPSPAGFSFFTGVLGYVPGVTAGNVSIEKLVPELTLEWNVNEFVLLYGRYTEGFKSGGFNGSYQGGTDSDTFSFNPEEVQSFELGTKLDLLNGAMTVNAALFRSEYTDLQVATFNATTAAFETINAAESVSQGLEIEARWQATDNFRVDLSMAFLDAFYDKFDGAPCTVEQRYGLASGCVANAQNLTDKELPFAPEFGSTLRLSYEQPISNSYSLDTALDIVYSDEYSVSLSNDPDFYSDASTKLDLRVGLENLEKNWGVALLLKNLTDEDEITSGLNNPLADGTKLAVRQQPRTISLQANYRW